MDKRVLVDSVIEQIKLDITNGDLTALDELLFFVPDYLLKGFLTETVETIVGDGFSIGE